MNFIDKQSKLSQELSELNVDTLRALFEAGSKDFQSYLANNGRLMQKLAETRDIAGYLEAQRDYGETLWEHLQEAVRNQGEILKEAVEKAGEAYRATLSETAG